MHFHCPINLFGLAVANTCEYNSATKDYYSLITGCFYWFRLQLLLLVFYRQDAIYIHPKPKL